MLLILILLIFTCVILIIVGIFVTFKAYKFVKSIILNNSTNYTDFDNISKKVIEQYKDCKIKTIYIYKDQIFKLNKYILNLFLKYIKSDQSIKDGKNINFYHSFILLELECDNYRKFIKIDKSQKITITDKIIISKDANFVSFKVKKQITLKRLLDETEKMYGTVNFYNWDILNSNCYNIVAEFMKVLEIKKRIDFIDEYNKRIKHKTVFGEYQIYIWRCMVFINSLDFMGINSIKKVFNLFFYPCATMLN